MEGKFRITFLFLFITEIMMFQPVGTVIYYGFINSRYHSQGKQEFETGHIQCGRAGTDRQMELKRVTGFYGGIMISIVFQLSRT